MGMFIGIMGGFFLFSLIRFCIAFAIMAISFRWLMRALRERQGLIGLILAGICLASSIVWFWRWRLVCRIIWFLGMIAYTALFGWTGRKRL